MTRDQWDLDNHWPEMSLIAGTTSLSQHSYNEGINYYNTTTGHSEPEDLDQSSIRFVTIYNQAFFN